MRFLVSIAKAFYEGFRSGHLCRRERKMRENMSEKKVDRMIEDSFPASDPPSTY